MPASCHSTGAASGNSTSFGPAIACQHRFLEKQDGNTCFRGTAVDSRALWKVLDEFLVGNLAQGTRLDNPASIQ
ncbi:MAG: hypothetical protein GYA24_19805 [Candidatus Lokiarchaeota archaeon]|nr:hypothetical protein [Candidatus Lokiarchaeota archaeon]